MDDTTFYWQISATMAAECNGIQDGPAVFQSVLTLDGRHVCGYLTPSEFPELFIGRRPIMVKLTPADFPAPQRPTVAYTP